MRVRVEVEVRQPRKSKHNTAHPLSAKDADAFRREVDAIRAAPDRMAVPGIFNGSDSCGRHTPGSDGMRRHTRPAKPFYPRRRVQDRA